MKIKMDDRPRITSVSFSGNIPVRATIGSAGHDLSAAEDTVINPGEIVLTPTGTIAHMSANDYLAVHARSSLSIKRKLMLANGVAVIDSDFNKPIMIPLYNFGTETQFIKAGERIAQGIFQEYKITNDDQVMGIRDGGFGSTGK